MSHLAIPFEGSESVDFLRAQNLTLKIENNKLEQETVELRHNLQLALTKAGSWGGMKQRITLTKPQSIVAERTWLGVEAAANQPSFDGAAVMDSLEQQLAEVQEQLSRALNDKQRLADGLRAKEKTIEEQRHEIDRLANLRGDKGTAAAYFQSQISFLHSEVERLEEVARVAQDEAIEKVRLAAVEHQRHLKERDDDVAAMKEEVQRVRAFAGVNVNSGGKLRGKLDGEDLLSRCRMMEVQLAAALAEKNALHVENGDLHAKVRKLESLSREKKQMLQEIQRTAASETFTSSEHAQRLSLLLAAANDERTKVTQELEEALVKLNVSKASSLSQTEPPPTEHRNVQCDPPVDVFDNGCQVDTLGHFADPVTQSAQALRHTLQTKCAEADDLRAQLDALAAVHKETLAFLEATKSRFMDERNRRAELESDVEGLSLQVRALQQQVSQQCAIDREKDILVQSAQEQQREAQAKLVKAEDEYRSLEDNVNKHKKDLQMLVASQNMNHQQVHELNHQNAVLHDEIQKLRIALEHDKYVIQAKDAELRDVVGSYQMLAKEADVLGSSREIMERENEGLRQTIRSLEERNVLCQEQIGHLHAREQQLSLDLQSFDHEVSQLHRRLHNCQAHEAEQSSQCQSHVNTIRALECTADELRRNLAELSKQVVIRDNECMLLRTRCDGVEKELASVSTAHRNESRRLRELEEANAQLMVRNILQHHQGSSASSSYQHNAAAQASRSESELQALQEALSRSSASLNECNAALQAEEQKKNELEQHVASLERQLREVRSSNDRLGRVANEQAAALSRLSK